MLRKVSQTIYHWAHPSHGQPLEKNYVCQKCAACEVPAFPGYLLVVSADSRAGSYYRHLAGKGFKKSALLEIFRNPVHGTVVRIFRVVVEECGGGWWCIVVSAVEEWC